MQPSARFAGTLTLAAICAGSAIAQTAAPAVPAAQAPAAAAAKATLNQKALDRLKAMGAHLRTLQAFTVTAAVIHDLVLDTAPVADARARSAFP